MLGAVACWCVETNGAGYPLLAKDIRCRPDRGDNALGHEIGEADQVAIRQPWRSPLRRPGGPTIGRCSTFTSHPVQLIVVGHLELIAKTIRLAGTGHRRRISLAPAIISEVFLSQFRSRGNSMDGRSVTIAIIEREQRE